VNTPRSAVDCGQATVEFALILPLFVLLIVALIDVTVIIRDQLLADTLARDAARVASTATSREDALNTIGETMSRNNRTDAKWRVNWADDLVTVQVYLEPRMSMSGATLQWLGVRQGVHASASFATEYDINEQ
jgi:Flp pilus assembly protein TadG